MELYDEELKREVYRCGIHTTEPLSPLVDPEAMVQKVEKAASEIVSEQRLPVIIGGDHSVSIGAIRAVANQYGPLDIVQFDAHTDLRDSYQGTRFSHACVMRRVWELGQILQVGIRSTSGEEAKFLGQRGKEPIWAKDILIDLDSCIKKLVGFLSGRPIYITIDLDCLDPGIMPSVGTPEPGGLQWHHLMALLSAITKTGQVKGFDVVELSPIPGLHAPDFLAARLIYRLIGYVTTS